MDLRGGFTLNHKPARFSGWERGKGLLVHKPGSVVIGGEFGGGVVLEPARYGAWSGAGRGNRTLN